MVEGTKYLVALSQLFIYVKACWKISESSNMQIIDEQNIQVWPKYTNVGKTILTLTIDLLRRN